MERAAQTTHGRAGAGPGNIVFLERAGVHALARVCEFDGHKYVLGLPNNTKEDVGERQIAIDLDRDDGNDGWINAPLPECCMCLDPNSADRFLNCQCTVPSVCRRCARSIKACPLCDECVLTSDECKNALYWLAHHRDEIDEGNQRYYERLADNRFPGVYAIEPSREGAQRMTLFTKTTSGSEHALEVRQEWTVRTVKIMYEEATGIPVDQPRLVFAGKLMKDDQTLADFNIQKESTVHVILRLMGD